MCRCQPERPVRQKRLLQDLEGRGLLSTEDRHEAAPAVVVTRGQHPAARGLLHGDEILSFGVGSVEAGSK